MKNIWFINEYDLPPEFSKFRRRYDMSKYLLKKKNTISIFYVALLYMEQKINMRIKKNTKKI